MRVAMALPPSRDTEGAVLSLAVGVAIAMHVALAFLAPGAKACRSCDHAPPLEVELAPSPPPPPLPAPVAEEKAPEPEPVRVAPSPRAAAVRAPAPAAAGKLLAAEPSVPQQEAPLDFVSDPSGGAYGFGVIARGGSRERVSGVAAPLPATTAHGGGAAPRGDGLAVAADLSEKPRLVNGDPCKGFYPSEASVDAAAAVVRVVVESDGRTRDVQLISEAPAGQGFGSAAERCLRSQRWSPAKDHDGKVVPTATTFRVRFTR